MVNLKTLSRAVLWQLAIYKVNITFCYSVKPVMHTHHMTHTTVGFYQTV